jgi:hypothetical protein
LWPSFWTTDEVLRVVAADRVEALERGDLQALEVLGLDRAGVALVLVLVLVVVVALDDRGRRDLLLEVEQAVDDVVDLELVLADLVGELEDLADRHRAGRDRHDHVLEAVLDALGDLDLALARQELDAAHLAHVHAHRVGRAAELAVERARGGFGFLLDVLGRRGGRRLRHQQRVGIGRLVEDLDAHVADHRDHAFDLLGVDELVGQVVVDLGVGQVAALLAEHDQALQAALARLDVGRGQLARRDVGLLPVAALLAAGLEVGRELRRHLAGGLGRGLEVDLDRRDRLAGAAATGAPGFWPGNRLLSGHGFARHGLLRRRRLSHGAPPSHGHRRGAGLRDERQLRRRRRLRVRRGDRLAGVLRDGDDGRLPATGFATGFFGACFFATGFFAACFFATGLREADFGAFLWTGFRDFADDLRTGFLAMGILNGAAAPARGRSGTAGHHPQLGAARENLKSYHAVACWLVRWHLSARTVTQRRRHFFPNA